MLAAPIPWPPFGLSMPWQHPMALPFWFWSTFTSFSISPEIIQAVAKQILAGKNNRTFLVILSPLVQIPPELEKQILVVEHELPTREQVKNIFSSICTGDAEAEFPGGNERESILDAAAGLTRYEAEGAASLSLVRHGRITAEAIWELKSQMLKKSGLLSLASRCRSLFWPGWAGRDEEFLSAGHAMPGAS